MGDATQGAGDALLRGGGALISGAVASKLRKVHCAPAVGALDAQVSQSVSSRLATTLHVCTSV